MLLLGLLLLCATAAFTGLLIADNLSGGPDHSVVVMGNTIATMNGLAIFLSGLALALIFCFALALTGVGGRMARRRRTLLRSARGSGATEPPRPADSARTTATAADEEAPTTVGASRAARPHRHLFGH